MLRFKTFIKIPSEIRAQGYRKINQYAMQHDLEAKQTELDASQRTQVPSKAISK
jgi:hypothetical protein